LLLLVAAILAVGITLFVETRSLPAPLAAFFFGVWTIRQIFRLTAESFPTIFDFAIILLVTAIPVLLILRVFGLPEMIWPVVDWASKILRKVENRYCHAVNIKIITFTERNYIVVNFLGVPIRKAAIFPEDMFGDSPQTQFQASLRDWRVNSRVNSVGTHLDWSLLHSLHAHTSCRASRSV
jgi:hypothetical protein